MGLTEPRRCCRGVGGCKRTRTDIVQNWVMHCYWRVQKTAPKLTLGRGIGWELRYVWLRHCKNINRFSFTRPKISYLNMNVQKDLQWTVWVSCCWSKTQILCQNYWRIWFTKEINVLWVTEGAVALCLALTCSISRPITSSPFAFLNSQLTCNIFSFCNNCKCSLKTLPLLCLFLSALCSYENILWSKANAGT